MNTRGKNKKRRKKKYNKKRTRKMKGRGIFSGPRYNPLKGPFGYRDSGNLLRGQQLGEICSKENKCAQNLWCNHYLSQEDADEWLLKYWDEHKAEKGWEQQMIDLYGAENEMTSAVGQRKLDRDFAEMEAADKADAAKQLDEDKKKYRAKSRNTRNYCRLPLLRKHSKATRTEALIAKNKVIQEKINTENEKLSTLSGEKKKTQLAKIQELKKELHDTSDILPEWKYCKNFCSKTDNLLKSKKTGVYLEGKLNKKGRWTSTNRIGCQLPDSQPDKGNLGQFVPGKTYKNQTKDDEMILDTEIKMFEGKYSRRKKGKKITKNDECGCVNWMSVNERAQFDMNATIKDIKGIWESLYPSTKPVLERNDEGELYWDKKKSANFKKWREKDNWNLGVERYKMLDDISDDPKGKDKQKKLNKIKIDNMILNLHYKLKLLYNYLVNPKNIKTKFIYTKHYEDDDDEEIEWEGECAFLDETGTEKTMKKWEEEHPGFSKCFYRTLVKKQFAQLILPITDKQNQMLNDEEKNANDILTKIKDLPNTPGEMFWKWIAGQSIVPSEEDSLASWKLMNKNIVEGFKRMKSNIYKKLTDLANVSDPNAFEAVFKYGYIFIAGMIENDLLIRGPPKPFLGKKKVFDRVKANIVNKVEPCSKTTSGGGKKRKTRRKKRSRKKKGGSDPTEIYMREQKKRIDERNAMAEEGENEDGSNSYYFPKLNEEEGICTPKYVFKNQICNRKTRNVKHFKDNMGNIGKRDDYNYYLPCYRSRCSPSSNNTVQTTEGFDGMSVCIGGKDAARESLIRTGSSGFGGIVAETKADLKKQGVKFAGEGERGSFDKTPKNFQTQNIIGDGIEQRGGGRKKKRRKTKRRRNKKKRSRKKKRGGRK